jgi:glucosamine kinase
LLAETVGGSANVRLGLDLVWANMQEAIDAALTQAGLDPAAYDRMSIGLGLAGITCAEDATATIAAGPRFLRCVASSDAHAACLGAFSGRDGGIIISGTGSAAYGWVARKAYQVGGWGFEVCDLGSAAELGREAIQAATAAEDGLAPATDFTRAVLVHLGGTRGDLVHWITDAKPRDYGTLAPLVMHHAEKGDGVAVTIVEKAAHDLGRYVARLHEIGARRVCLVGGMAPVFTPWLSTWARSVLAEPEHDALEGALLMAQGHPTGYDPASEIPLQTVEHDL